jgi:hypothetical protein
VIETTIIGAIFLVHGIAIAILALTLPTGMFLAVSRPVGLPIIAVGLTILIWYQRRRRKTPQDETPQAAGSDDDQPS